MKRSSDSESKWRVKPVTKVMGKMRTNNVQRVESTEKKKSLKIRLQQRECEQRNGSEIDRGESKKRPA